MFSRRKAPQGQLLEELQQTYNDVSNTTINNLALEDKELFGDALKGWKALHTSLLYKIDIFERKYAKLGPDETALLAELKAIRDENVKHLVRMQLRLDEQTRKAQRAAANGGSPSSTLSPAAAPGASSSAHKMSIPSLRTANAASRSLTGSGGGQRHMVKSLRSGGSSANYQLSPQHRDTVKAAANISWARPKPASVGSAATVPASKKYDGGIFEDFDQNEISVDRWERLNSVGSSDSHESVNLIDLDDSHSSVAHKSLEDLSISKKKPPPVPPKRGGLRLSPTKSKEPSSSSHNSGSSLARPVIKSNIKSTSDIPDTKNSEKKFVYKQPQPLNVSKMMQQSGARSKPQQNGKLKRPTVAGSAPRAHSATDTSRGHGSPSKKSTITYNYKPIEKPKTTATRPKKQTAKSTPKSTVARTAPTSPYLNSIIDDYDSDGAGQPQEPVVGDPAEIEETGPEEDEALIRSIKGIDELAAHQILNDIVVTGDEVYWDDIVGLESAKNSLKEAVVYPFLRPDLFRGLREPTRGMLLFGPPGTGKTMLARAVATESKSTFFSISSSSLTSKYLGESEKLVKALFLLAKRLSPSIVFIDEIDSLLGTRNEGEVESMRRIKNEFLVQWSELSSAAAGRDTTDGDVSRVLILGATNLPWAIDEAARRRFAKRVYIPLPEDETRKLQISKLLAYQKHTLSDDDYDRLVELTRGFSGSDITLLAKDSAMGPLRSLGDKLLSTPTEEIRPIQLEDFIESLKYIRPSVSSEGLGEYEKWSAKFGSSGA